MNPENSGQSLCTRRHWVKQFMLGSAVAMGATWRSRLLADISPSVAPTDILTFHVATDFPDLLTGNTPSIQVQISGFPEVIMITLVSFGMFVLNSRCTHLGCTVRYWNAADNILCPCHGSNYNIDGSLIIGAVGNTAQNPLAAYEFNWDGEDLLQIHVPGLALTINQVAVEKITSDNTRLRLDFPGRAWSTYQVLYSPDLLSEPQLVTFALTADGAADQSSVDIDSETPVSVWVDNPASQGFYSVELVVSQLFY